ncbi:hypothetical protein ANCDUO_12081 [Ancylostoma duodenale]|uniref:Uncharacterized protein n=1 Tax=Ancylostoma duodenale TaxID=51022 RepID=A0A0C2GFP7_9BILA|nr:hypothetical protein ANCDUO_12081 [Ancylostoma duodenale]
MSLKNGNNCLSRVFQYSIESIGPETEAISTLFPAGKSLQTMNDPTKKFRLLKPSRTSPYVPAATGAHAAKRQRRCAPSKEASDNVSPVRTTCATRLLVLFL